MDENRAVLRRQAYELNTSCLILLNKVKQVDPAAAEAIEGARFALFDAWTMLCRPPEEDEDH